MFTNNKFGKLDAVADAIKSIAEADYKAKMEELKGQQHKIDKNKNNKVDADDFKILRGEKKAMKEEDSLDEGTMTHITLGNKVKNSDGGHNQDVHYKGKKIGHIESYKHRSGLRYGSKHDASGQTEAGSRSPEEAIDFVRTSHGDHLKSMKNESLEEGNNPFDLKNYKSQLPTKPGEKAGFDSKKVSTGTIYSRKPVKDEPMKKEEIDPNDTTTDTLKGREKTSNNPFLSKKVKMDVPDNVKEEAEQVEERTLTKGETSEKERIVKGMKKSLKGFKARYGDKAKSVMYATATKAAKKD